MSLIETTQPPTSPALPKTLRLGAVHLTVADLCRSVAWYQRSLGLRIHTHDLASAVLGDGQGDRRRAARGPAGAARRSEGELDLDAFAQTPSDLARVERIVGNHLERFGRRDELVVRWTEADR